MDTDKLTVYIKTEDIDTERKGIEKVIILMKGE